MPVGNALYDDVHRIAQELEVISNSLRRMIDIKQPKPPPPPGSLPNLPQDAFNLERRPDQTEVEGVSVAEVDSLTMQTAGMAAIAHLLRNPVYGVGMLEDIARIVEDCGHDLTNVNGRRTWEQH